MLGITLWSEKYDDYQLKQIGQALTNEVKKITDVADINIIGGRSREVKVLLDKNKMAENHIDFLSISKQVQGSNTQVQGGNLLKQDTSFSVETGNFLNNADDVANLVVGINQQQPVYLKQLALVQDGLRLPANTYCLGMVRLIPPGPMPSNQITRRLP